MQWGVMSAARNLIKTSYYSTSMGFGQNLTSVKERMPLNRASREEESSANFSSLAISSGEL